MELATYIYGVCFHLFLSYSQGLLPLSIEGLLGALLTSTQYSCKRQTGSTHKELMPGQ